MVGKTLVALDAVLGAAYRPIEDHAQRGLRVGHAESGDRAAAHAGAHDVRAPDVQMLQQPLALRHVVRPGDALDAAARLATLAPVEDDAAVLFRQVLEELDPGVDALRAPLLHRRIEATWRIHQQRRPRADHLVARLDAADDDLRQGVALSGVARCARLRRRP